MGRAEGLVATGLGSRVSRENYMALHGPARAD